MSWIWDNLLSKKKERISLVGILALVIFVLFAKFFISFIFKPYYPDLDDNLFSEVVILENEYKAEKEQRKKAYQENSKNEISKSEKKKSFKKADDIEKKKASPAIPTTQLFLFDPNKISLDSLLMLGLSKYAANNLVRYREKGGRIYNKEKFKSIYGIDEATYEKLKNYIEISPRQTSNYQRDTTRKNKSNYKKSFKKKPPPKPIEINTADTLIWRSLPGIGPVYSRRIVNFREKLGGFFNINQVGDCYGLPDSVFTSIKPFLQIDPSKIQKTNINNVTKETFVMHPYIDWKAAKVIISYRKMHGDFQDINKLYDLYGIEKSLIDTIVIYFDVE